VFTGLNNLNLTAGDKKLHVRGVEVSKSKESRMLVL
jgi:hypothetical protein